MADRPYANLFCDLDTVDPRREGYGIEDPEACGRASRTWIPNGARLPPMVAAVGSRYDAAVFPKRRTVTDRRALEEGLAA